MVRFVGPKRGPSAGKLFLLLTRSASSCKKKTSNYSTAATAVSSAGEGNMGFNNGDSSEAGRNKTLTTSTFLLVLVVHLVIWGCVGRFSVNMMNEAVLIKTAALVILLDAAIALAFMVAIMEHQAVIRRRLGHLADHGASIRRRIKELTSSVDDSD